MRLPSNTSKPCRPSFPRPGLPASPNHSRNLALLRRASAAHGCLDAVECDQCLEGVARALVLTLECSLERARAMTAEEYQAELGVEICDLERARELKWMTTRACYTAEPVNSEWAPRQGLAFAARAAEPGRASRWRRFCGWLADHPFQGWLVWVGAVVSGVLLWR